jgi:hypothetical protein
MKANGTSFYAFPGASEDIASTKNDPNLNFYFSHYVLLNFPKQNLVAGTQSNPVVMDFDSSFYRVNNIGQQATSFKDQLIESLRNYVANHEVTIKESRINNTEFYYDSTQLSTTAEKIFFKWCRKLNLLQLERAIDGDEYFGDLMDFERNNLTDDAYLPEVLWKERDVNDYSIKAFSLSATPGYVLIEFETTRTNYKIGDTILITNIDDTSDYFDQNDLQFKILDLIDEDNSNNQRAIINMTYQSDEVGSGTTRLVYHKFVQYIGNVNGVNNVQEANRSYQEVWAHVPAHTGQTPDLLFRTIADRNYKPNMLFPILPGQYQPEILGAELFNSPIVSNPQNYPGNYFGQFDSEFEYTYRCSDGDSLRRTGEYFGMFGDITAPVVDSTNIDGISIDFNTNHYVKMNILDNEVGTFEQFNAMMVDNEPPKDFEFNAILWYYTLEDNDGNTATNLYGISFLDNPDNNPIEEETGFRIAPVKKLVATDTQDGTAYAFSLNLNYNIINDIVQDTFNPSAVNSLFSFNLFNEAMTRLSQSNDSFNQVIAEQNFLRTEISNLKQLIYTQGDFANINSKITYLETLLNGLQTLQIQSSDTVNVIVEDSISGFPVVSLTNIDPAYHTIYNLLTTQLYNEEGIIPYKAGVPNNKNFLINIVNNDNVNQILNNNDKLTVYLDTDLSYKQSVDINIDSTEIATQNKQLEIYINYTVSDGVTSIPVLTRAIGPVDFPIYFNTNTQSPTIARKSDNFSLEVDFSNSIQLSNNSFLTLPILNMTGNVLSNIVKKGDVLSIHDLVVGTSSTTDMSGQYRVEGTDSTNLILDLSTNINVNNFVSQNIFGNSLVINTLLSSRPYIRTNHSQKWRITRVTENSSDVFSARYLIYKL